MNSLPHERRVRLVVPLLLAGCSAALLFGLWISAAAGTNTQDLAPELVPIAPPPIALAMPNAETQPLGPFSCTVIITTADYLHASTNKLVPTDIGNLNKLTLIPIPESATTQTTDINWFMLFPAQAYKTYAIDAMPTNGVNYDLGMYVYDNPAPGQYIDVYTTTDPTDYMATASFVPTDAGPYVVAIFQKSTACLGGTYDLHIFSATPTPGARSYFPLIPDKH